MGIWDYVSSTTDSIRRNAPDLTSVKGLYWTSYGYSRAAVDKVYPYWSDVEARAKGFYRTSYDYSHAAVDKVYPYWSDEETRSQIAANLAKNTAVLAVREGAKLFPGGSIGCDLVLRSIPSVKKSKEYKEDPHEFKDMVGRTKTEEDRMMQELKDCKRLIEKLEMHKLITELKTEKILDLNKNAGDVIRIITTTKFTGLDDPTAPGVSPKKHPK